MYGTPKTAGFFGSVFFSVRFGFFGFFGSVSVRFVILSNRAQLYSPHESIGVNRHPPPQTLLPTSLYIAISSYPKIRQNSNARHFPWGKGYSRKLIIVNTRVNFRLKKWKFSDAFVENGIENIGIHPKINWEAWKTIQMDHFCLYTMNMVVFHWFCLFSIHMVHGHFDLALKNLQIYS